MIIHFKNYPIANQFRKTLSPHTHPFLSTHTNQNIFLFLTPLQQKKRKAKSKCIDFPFLLQQRLFLTSSPVQLHLLLSTEVAQPNCRGSEELPGFHPVISVFTDITYLCFSPGSRPFGGALLSSSK